MWQAILQLLLTAPNLLGDLVAAIRYYVQWKEKTALYEASRTSRATQQALKNEIYELRKTGNTDDASHADELRALLLEERASAAKYLSDTTVKTASEATSPDA